MFPKASASCDQSSRSDLVVKTLALARIHWAMAVLLPWLKRPEKNLTLKAQLRIIHYFVVFHDFGETGSGRFSEKGALNSRQ